MSIIEFECRKYSHVGENIKGFCLQPDCKETRQFCQKCYLDIQIHNQCRSYCLQFQQINDYIVSLIDSLEYQLSSLEIKYQVLNRLRANITQNILNQKQIFEEILKNLKLHKYQDFKSQLPLIIRSYEMVNHDKKFIKFIKGMTLSKNGAIEEAIKLFDEIIKEDQSYGNSYYQKGLLMMKLAKKNQELWLETVNCFDQSIKIDLYNFDAHKQKGLCLFEMKKYDQAIKSFNYAIKFGGNDEECQFYKGRALQEIKEYDEACKIFDQILKININHCESYYQKGLSLYNLKLYQEAVELLDKALLIDPKHIQAYVYKGQSLLSIEKQDKVREARECFIKAIQIDPMNLQAYLGKAQTFNQYEDKMKTLNEAIEAGIKSTELIYQKGIVLQKEMKFDKAIEQYDMIAGDYPDQQALDMLYFNKGNNKYIIQKKYQEAVDCFSKAQLVESKQIETQIYLGLSLQKLNRHQEAIKCFENVINKGYQNEKIYYKKGCLYYYIGISLQQLGQHIQAIRCFDQAILKCEKWPNAYKLKSKSLREMGKTLEAIKWEEKSKLLINEQAVTITSELLFSTNQSNSVSKIRQNY